MYSTVSGIQYDASHSQSKKSKRNGNETNSISHQQADKPSSIPSGSLISQSNPLALENLDLKTRKKVLMIN